MSTTARLTHDRDSILRGSIEVFNRHGYDATTMAQLAGHLGVTKAAIYHHVEGKEHLLRLALDRALGGLESVLDDPLASTGPAVDRLRHVLRSAVGVLTEELPSVTLLLRLRGNTELERQALERRRAVDRQIAALVEEARSEGAIRSDLDAHTQTRLLFGMINSIVEWYRPEGSTSAAEVAEAVVSMAFTGLRGPA